MTRGRRIAVIVSSVALAGLGFGGIATAHSHHGHHHHGDYNNMMSSDMTSMFSRMMDNMSMNSGD